MAEPIEHGPYGNLIALLRHVMDPCGSCKYALQSGGVLQIMWERSVQTDVKFSFLQDDTEVLSQRQVTVSKALGLETSFAVEHGPLPLLGTQVGFHDARGFLWRVQFVTSMVHAQHERASLERLLSTPRLLDPRPTTAERARILSETVKTLYLRGGFANIDDDDDEDDDDDDRVLDYTGWQVFGSLSSLGLSVAPDEELEGHISDLLSFEKEEIPAPYLSEIKERRIWKILNSLLHAGVVSGSPEEILEEQVVSCFLPRLAEEGLSRHHLRRRVKLSKQQLERILNTPRTILKMRFKPLVRIATALNAPLFGISASPKDGLQLKTYFDVVNGAPRGSAEHGLLLPPIGSRWDRSRD